MYITSAKLKKYGSKYSEINIGAYKVYSKNILKIFFIICDSFEGNSINSEKEMCQIANVKEQIWNNQEALVNLVL